MAGASSPVVIGASLHRTAGGGRPHTIQSHKKKASLSAGFLDSAQSVKMERNFDANRNGYRFAIFHGGLELPLIDRLNCLFVETQSQAAGKMNVARPAIRTNDQADRTGALILCLAGFF